MTTTDRNYIPTITGGMNTDALIQSIKSLNDILYPMPIFIQTNQRTVYNNTDLGFNLSMNGNENTLGALLCLMLAAIKGVYYNDPYTTVKWGDGTATTVRCTDADAFSKETGFIYCVMKKVLGDTNFHNILKNVTKNGKDIKATKLYKKLEREAKKREAEERNGNDNT